MAIDSSPYDKLTVDGALFFDAPGENDFYDGTSREDVFVIDDVSAGYSWAIAQDGVSLVLWKGEEHSVLWGIELLRFNDIVLRYEEGVGFTTEPYEGAAPVALRYEDKPGEPDFATGFVADNDEFVVDGNFADYTLGLTEDGLGVSLYNANSFAVLHDIELIRFNDTLVHFDGSQFTVDYVEPEPEIEPEPLPLVFLDRVGQNDFYTGSASAADSFVVDGLSTDYTWAVANDGEGMVVWNDSEYAVLHDIEMLRFNDAIVNFAAGEFTVEPIEGAVIPPKIFVDTVGETDFATGSLSIADEFIIDGLSTDWNWALANDGVGAVIWNDAEYNVLHDVEIIRFNDAIVNFAAGEFTLEPIEGAVIPPKVFVDVVGENDFHTGSLSTADEFVIDALSSDWNWALANDGVGISVWKGDEFAVLHEVEILRFNDLAMVHRGEGVFEVLGGGEGEPTGPVIVDDAITTVGGALVRIPQSVLLANDDLDGSAAGIANAQVDPAQGWVFINGSILGYMPAQGFAGTATITYDVISESGQTATLSVQVGTDGVVGGDETDILVGGDGDDSMTGAAGADIFVASFGQDVVTDFSQADGDAIVLDTWLDQSGDMSYLDDFMSVTQVGADAVLRYDLDGLGEGIEAHTMTLQNVDFSAYASASELLASGLVGGTAPAVESPAIDYRLVEGTTDADSLSGDAGADRFVISTGHDTISNILFAEGDVLDFSALIPNGDNIDNYVVVSQNGADAVVSTVVGGDMVWTTTLESTDLSAFANASDLVEAGYFSY